MPEAQYASRKRALDRIAREKVLYQRRSGGDVSVCVVYPNAYRLGMANLGYQAIFQIFDSHPSVEADRVFLPDPDEREAMRAGKARLLSFEHARPLSDFDILAFSVAFETDYLNVLGILRMAGIPPRRSERAGRSYPLIIAGGSAIFLNPEPIADLIDMFLIGEGEEMVPSSGDVPRIPTGTGSSRCPGSRGGRISSRLLIPSMTQRAGLPASIIQDPQNHRSRGSSFRISIDSTPRRLSSPRNPFSVTCIWSKRAEAANGVAGFAPQGSCIVRYGIVRRNGSRARRAAD